MAWVREVPRENRPHLLVLDLQVDRGPSAQPEVVATLVQGGLKVVVLSALASVPVVRAVIRAGVSAIVGKRDSEEAILEAVHAALRGEQWMTEELAAVIASDPDRPTLSGQEERALILYASGMTIADVAEAMGIGWETTRQYLDRIKTKYTAAGIPVKSKLDLGRIAVADGYIEG
ncbi:hypothetical protein NS183_13620 [Microbacterium testaceum]|nr:hypothetical protein NS183_13620 [Microbacterium testaceum]